MKKKGKPQFIYLRRSKKTMKEFISLCIAAILLLSLAACAKTDTDVSDIFDSNEKISYSTTFKELSKIKNKTSAWRQGMVSGNGMQGFVESGSPYSDTLIFQNMHFIMPNVNVRYCPDTSNELEAVKQNIVKGEDIIDNASYDDVYRFHPGGELRIDMEKAKVKDYFRYTDYKTGQVGIEYTDKNGKWLRSSFTSMADGAVITKIAQSQSGSKVKLTLSFDNISAFAKFGDSDEVNIQYKKIVSDDLSSISFVAHYPDYENSELKQGGYATVTYIVTDGAKEKVLLEEVKDEQYAAKENPGLKITDATEVYLVTVSDRTYDMGKMADFANTDNYALVTSLAKSGESLAKKYEKNGLFDYDTALNNHLEIYKPQFDAVTIKLGDEAYTASNDAILLAQRGKKKISSALAERAYYSGRYAYLCCSGYSTSRLAGMWTGEWYPGWGSKYTMDANVNLQTSSMNTSNLSGAPIGYTYFILRQLPDWEENAKATHGYTEAIQAPVNTDGDKAVITETCYPYPFRYWNAGTSWMIQPLYETLQCYGSLQIPLSDEFDLNALKSVLSPTDKDLTDADINAIEEKGYLDLEKDILLPLLIKSANYWVQLMTPEYYTDKNGDIHYEKGKTSLSADEYFCILPSYSPENNPSNYPSPSDANCAIDISACRDNIEMLLTVAKDTNCDISMKQYEYLLSKLPPYIYDSTGALKEWATNQFEENNEHRHLSHLYCVWPLFETQNNEELKNACEQAIANRESENEASHALIHRSLIAARLKDRDSLSAALLKLMNHRIHYNSLLTNHDYDRGSCYCTDFAIGYLGIINESLVYSNNGEIEILPALPTSGFEKGEITGLRTRTQAEIVSLKWNIENGSFSVTIKSDIEQTIKVSCGLAKDVKTVAFAKGEVKTIEF